MSIIPIAYDSATQIYTMHDQINHHIFDVPLAELEYGQNMDGSVNLDQIKIACREPDCPVVSWHPIGGGADPLGVQIMFIRHEFYEATNGPAEIKAMVMALDHVSETENNYDKTQHVLNGVHERVAKMDGDLRWALSDADTLTLVNEFNG